MGMCIKELEAMYYIYSQCKWRKMNIERCMDLPAYTLFMCAVDFHVIDNPCVIDLTRYGIEPNPGPTKGDS